MHRSLFSMIALIAVCLTIGPTAFAEHAPVTVAGKSACAQCSGIAKGHDITLTTANGITFVLKGEGDAYKAVHAVRKQGKAIEATLAGPIKPMLNDSGELYIEAPVRHVEITGDSALLVKVSGKSACAKCSGLTKGHDIAIVMPNGMKIVLKGNSEQYKAVHKVRKGGKLVEAVLAGTIVSRTNEKGEAYLEAQTDRIQVVPAVTLVGTTACSQCSGVAKGHDILLKTKNDVLFVLKGSGDQYMAVHKIRKEGKPIKVTLAGDLQPMKNADGQVYFEAKVSALVPAAKSALASEGS